MVTGSVFGIIVSKSQDVILCPDALTFLSFDGYGGVILIRNVPFFPGALGLLTAIHSINPLKSVRSNFCRYSQKDFLETSGKLRFFLNTSNFICSELQARKSIWSIFRC